MKNNGISQCWLKLFKSLSESQKRWFAATKSLELGYGGTSSVSKITGLSRTTIIQGINEIRSKKKFTLDKVRSEGGGRKSLKNNESLVKDLESILAETSAGNPMNNLKWTIKSSKTIAENLSKKGHNISYMSVQRLLHEEGYSLQANRKMLPGKNHPNRDEQFRHINRTVNRFIKNGNPVISVDTKKKELIGNFKNQGRSWHLKGEGPKVLDHDFRSYGEGVAIPYGAYDVKRNEGFVNVGISSDTSEFAVNSVWQWWRHFGRKNYIDSDELLICADGGGSNSSRSRAWKFFLQDLANKLGISIHVCHYPPGTSKWNKIEHKMFSFISLNWKGKPLENFESVVNLISNTTTNKGLKVGARLDKIKYQKGMKISDEDFDALQLKFHNKFPEWNYKITPIV
jgi:transposase